jgi:hypothetical protein
MTRHWPALIMALVVVPGDRETRKLASNRAQVKGDVSVRLLVLTRRVQRGLFLLSTHADSGAPPWRDLLGEVGVNRPDGGSLQ